MPTFQNWRVSCPGLALLLLAAGAPRLGAQSLNLDVGSALGVPSSAYGGGAKQPGFWNVVEGGFPGVVTPLQDLAAAPTGITVRYQTLGNGLGGYAYNHALTTGDDEALMDDLQDVGSGVISHALWTFDGLRPGLHLVVTHAWSPDDSFLDVSMVRALGSRDPVQLVGGSWPGKQKLGVTFARHAVVVGASGRLEVVVEPLGGRASVNGFQLVDLTGCPTPATYCTAKPNSLGCPAELTTIGIPSVNFGRLFTVRYSPIPGGNVGLFLYTTQGALATPIQSVYGWQCVNGSGLFRTPVSGPSGTTGSCNGLIAIDFKTFFKTQTADPSLVVGATVDMQGWYRDPASPGAANLSEAIAFSMCP